MKIFSCNAIFFSLPDHHNAAKNKTKQKPQDKEKNRTFSKTELKKIKLQFFWEILRHFHQTFLRSRRK